jgi:urea transporter
MKLNKNQYNNLFTFLALVAIAVSGWTVYAGAAIIPLGCCLVALVAILIGIRLVRKMPDDASCSATCTVGYPADKKPGI